MHLARPQTLGLSSPRDQLSTNEGLGRVITAPSYLVIIMQETMQARGESPDYWGLKRCWNYFNLDREIAREIWRLESIYSSRADTLHQLTDNAIDLTTLLISDQIILINGQQWSQ